MSINSKLLVIFNKRH